MTPFVRHARSAVVAVVAALALAVAPAVAAQASGPGAISVTITADGTPVAGTFMSLEGPEPVFALTDSDGVAQFADLALGEHTIVVPMSPSHQEARALVTLTLEQPQWSGTVALEPWPVGTASITTTVLEAGSDDPIADINVQLARLDGPGPYIEGVTGPDGVFVATGLVAGVYWVSTVTTPDYFETAAEVVVAEDEAGTLTLRVAARDAAIEGRVVGPDGLGVPDLTVSAQLVDAPTGTGTITDAEGWYRIEGAVAGTWTLSTYPDSNWEAASVTVVATAGATTTAPDLVLAPRRTGTIAGLVGSVDRIPESTIGGFFDVCVTTLDATGTPVPGASTVTGGDSFFAFFLEPGQYTVFFEDCDDDRQPHRYGEVYLGGAATLGEATFVTVETGVDTWLDTTTLPLASTQPTHDASPLPKKQLKRATRGLVDVPGHVRRGQAAVIVVGEQFAGDWVSAWVYSSPQQLGAWHQVAADGTVAVPIPTDAPLGRHRISIQDAEDDLIGWEWATVLKRPKH